MRMNFDMGRGLLRNIMSRLEPFKAFQSEVFLGNVFEEGVATGLDIGTYAVKVVRLRRSVKDLSLETRVYREILRSPDPKGSIPEETLTAQCLADIWQQEKIKDKKVRVVVSDPGIYIRHIHIPRLAPNELAKAARWQAEKYIPFSIEDASVDYQIIDERSPQDPGQMEVAIVAVEKKTIDKYLRVLKAARLTPTVIDIPPFAVAKAVLQDLSPKETSGVAVIDIGHRTTSVTILKRNSLRLARSFEIGGHHMTQSIVEGMGLDRAEAESMKRELGVEPFAAGQTVPDKYAAAIHPVLSELVKQIERGLAYSEREEMTEGIAKVLLCGGGALTRGLDAYLANHLKLSVSGMEGAARILSLAGTGGRPSPEPAALLVSALGAAL
ncbi:MAG: type IV pilus assembly protein PilM [Candidatus Omnitrophota bacterium]|nr:type IV pilus assembly protein PilM [Candidatus Omnitrophota bacterium]MDZ4241930.1 type IV pilus assembly protein PilM [Candidatus Omnitrophota bacterium]